MYAPTIDLEHIALFDMDETLVDFTGPLRKRLEAMCGDDETVPDDLWSMPPHWYERAQAIKREPGFWRNLPRLQWGWDVLEIAKEIGFDPCVLTKRPTTGNRAVFEKAEWCDEHLPGMPLNIVDDKRIIYGKVFVDDYFPFMKLWLKHRPRGLGVVNYSSNHPACKDQLVSIQDGMDEIRRRLQEAYDR